MSQNNLIGKLISGSRAHFSSFHEGVGRGGSGWWRHVSRTISTISSSVEVNSSIAQNFVRNANSGSNEMLLHRIFWRSTPLITTPIDAKNKNDTFLKSSWNSATILFEIFFDCKIYSPTIFVWMCDLRTLKFKSWTLETTEMLSITQWERSWVDISRVIQYELFETTTSPLLTFRQDLLADTGDNRGAQFSLLWEPLIRFCNSISKM